MTETLFTITRDSQSNQKERFKSLLVQPIQYISEIYPTIDTIFKKINSWDLLFQGMDDLNNTIFPLIFYTVFEQNLRSALILAVNKQFMDTGMLLRKILETIVISSFFTVIFPPDRRRENTLGYFRCFYESYSKPIPVIKTKEFYSMLRKDFGSAKTQGELLKKFFQQRSPVDSFFLFMKPICKKCFEKEDYSSSPDPLIVATVPYDANLNEFLKEEGLLSEEEIEKNSEPQVKTGRIECYICSQFDEELMFSIIQRPDFYMMTDVLESVFRISHCYMNKKMIYKLYSDLSRRMVHFHIESIHTQSEKEKKGGINIIRSFLDIISPLIEGTIDIISSNPSN